MLVNEKKKWKLFFGWKLYLYANIRYRSKNKSTFFNFENFKSLFEKKIGNGFLVKNFNQSLILQKGLKINQHVSI